MLRINFLVVWGVSPTSLDVAAYVVCCQKNTSAWGYQGDKAKQHESGPKEL